MAEFREVIKIYNRMCKSVFCSDCPLNAVNVKTELAYNCREYMEIYPQQAEKLMTQWAKDNPVKTNADKFEEVFGKSLGDICNDIPCDCKCDNCDINKFLSQEYKEPERIEEEKE